MKNHFASLIAFSQNVEKVPSSILINHPDVTIYVDEDAFSFAK
jgi:6-phosphogluconolactonase/glucosamine-6-phosphate isomerase/deaminase